MKKIELTQGKVALVDDWNYEWLNQWKWHARKQNKGNYYAVRSDHKITETVYMHRVIMKTPINLVVDHIDHNTLDNQEHNLRNCTVAQNTQNSICITGSSNYKGVCWDKRCKKWKASIQKNGRTVHLKNCADEHLAATLYNAAATKYFGEFAYLNKLPEEYERLLNEAYKILEGEKLCSDV